MARRPTRAQLGPMRSDEQVGSNWLLEEMMERYTTAELDDGVKFIPPHPVAEWSPFFTGAAGALATIDQPAPGAGLRLVVLGVYASYDLTTQVGLFRLRQGAIGSETVRTQLHVPGAIHMAFNGGIEIPENMRAVVDLPLVAARIASVGMYGYTINT